MDNTDKNLIDLFTSQIHSGNSEDLPCFDKLQAFKFANETIETCLMFLKEVSFETFRLYL